MFTSIVMEEYNGLFDAEETSRMTNIAETVKKMVTIKPKPNPN